MSRNWTSYGVYRGEEFCGMARTIRKARAIVRSAGADSVLRWHQTPSQNIVEDVLDGTKGGVNNVPVRHLQG